MNTYSIANLSMPAYMCIHLSLSLSLSVCLDLLTSLSRSHIALYRESNLSHFHSKLGRSSDLRQPYHISRGVTQLFENMSCSGQIQSGLLGTLSFGSKLSQDHKVPSNHIGYLLKTMITIPNIESLKTVHLGTELTLDAQRQLPVPRRRNHQTWGTTISSPTISVLQPPRNNKGKLFF